MPSQIGEYKLTKTLGCGITSKVKLGQDANGHYWAVKIFDKTNPNVNDGLLKALQAEVQELKKLNHDNIVTMREFNIDGVWIKNSGNIPIAYIVLELIEEGELFDFIANGGPFSEEISRFYFKQMLSALHYMHSQGTTHRDLKPENMLISKNFDLKIADFGFAAPTQGRDGSGQLLTKLGTESYMAPEIHQRSPYQGQIVDLFATAIILFIMMTGHPPFTQALPNDRFYKFISGNRADVFWKSHARSKQNGFTKEFTDLLTSMFQLIPSQRLAMADIVGHPWMKAGAMATQEEVRIEFEQRRANIAAMKAEEQAAKDQARAIRLQAQGNGVNRDIIQGVVFMSGETETETEMTSKSQRKLGEHNAQFHKNTEFYSAYPADMIFDDLCQHILQDESAGKDSVKQDPSKWKMTVNFKTKVSNYLPIEVEGQQQQAQEENKQEEAEEALETQLVIKLLQVNENKLAVEFSHTGGSKQFFYSQYRQLIAKVDHLNDVSL